MSNTITIKHGELAPGTSQLEKFEFGYCTGDGKLYFNANGTIKSFLPNIENGLTLNNNVSIFSCLQDGTPEDIIFRSSSNNTWVGGRAVASNKIGYLVLAVGKGPNGDGEENVYIHRSSKGTGTTINELIYDETSIRNGFVINNNVQIDAFLKDGTRANLIERTGNHIWIGSRTHENQGNAYIGVGTAEGASGDLFISRANVYAANNNSGGLYKVYDELNIKNGFRINNNAEITTFLSDGTTTALLIKRANDNVWIGQRGLATQGNIYLGVGEGVNSTGYAYVVRGQNYVSSTDYSDLSMVYDEHSIGNGFTLNNDYTLKTKLADGTKCTALYRSPSNHLWVGGSNGSGSTTAIGRVILAVGDNNGTLSDANAAYVFRKGTSEYGKILDYGYIVKAIWSGSCAVGGTFSIPNFEDYRLFLFFQASSNTVLLVTRRGNYLRGGTTYANGGIYFETIRCNGTSSGTFTYTEGRSYTLTSSGATSNWGTTANPAPAINTIYGVL